MPSINDLANSGEKIPAHSCGVGYLLDISDPDTREAIETVLAGRYRNVDIADTDEFRAHDVGANAIGRHRRGGCKCGKQ